MGLSMYPSSIHPCREKFGTLCLVYYISLVISALALNLVPLESLFTFLCKDVLFVRIMDLWHDKHNGEVGEVPQKPTVCVCVYTY